MQHKEPGRDKAATTGGGEGTPLEQRLRALVESEREGQELLQELRKQRLAARQEDAERRLAVLEKALAEARTESARRKETEQALGRERDESAHLAAELRKAQRMAEEARKEVRPRAARKIAETEKAAADARAEAERERAKREELERELETVKGSEQRVRAEAASERAKRAALERQIEEFHAREEAARQSHEQQISELEHKRAETERTATDAEQALAQQRAERSRERERLRAIEQLIHAATESEYPGQETPASPEPSPPKSDAAAPGPPVRKKRPFQARGSTCAVCKRTETKSPGGLKAEGWALGSEIDLCPDCQAKGWELPKGGRIPFRRSAARDEAG